MIKRIIPSSEFSKNVLKLISGAAIAQVITLAFAPVLSRLYSPEEFGIFTVYISVVSAIAVIITARYEAAIVLPREDEKAVNIVGLSLIVSLCVSLAAFIVILLLVFFVFRHFNFHDDLEIMLLTVPILTFLLGIYQTLNNWNIRKKRFKDIAKSRVINSFTNNGSAFLSPNLQAWGLVFANFIGQLFLSGYLLFSFLKKDKDLLKSVTKKRMLEQAKTYIVFPKTNTLQSIIEMLQQNGIIYLLPLFFTLETVGYYSRTFIVMQAPISLIGAAIAQVFYQRASEIYTTNKKHLPDLYRSTIFKSALIALPILVALLFFGPELFVLVFGKQWRESGVYAQILAPWIFFDFMRVSVAHITNVIGMQKQMFYYSSVGALVLFLSLCLTGGTNETIFTCLSALSIGMSVYILFLLIIIYNALKRHVNQIV